MERLIGELGSDAWRGVLAALLDCGVKGLLLLLLAALIAGAMRRASAAARHLVWTLALAGLLLLPALSLVTPKWRLPILPPFPAAPEPALAAPVPSAAPQISMPSAQPLVDPFPIAAPSAAPSSANAHRALPESAPPQPAAGLPAPSAPRPWALWLAALWLAGALACLAPLAVGMALVRRLARRAHDLNGGEWPALADALRWALGLRRPVRLLQSPGDLMPMAAGLLRPVILLPAEAAEWPEPRRRAVLLHELAHVKRRDCLTHALARLACALHWPNPLAWWALRRLRLERERACDDLVLAAGERASDYAGHLLQVAGSMRAGALAAAAAVTMARRSQLEGRLLAILDATRNRRAITRSMLVAGLLLLALFLPPLAAMRLGAAPVKEPVAPAQSPSAPSASTAFTSGVRARIAGITTHPRSGAFWAADGALLPKAPVGFEKNESGVTTSPGQFAREFDVVLEGLPAGGDFDVNTDISSATLTSRSTDAVNGQLRLVLGAAFPKAARSTTLRLGLASGPWRKLTSVPLGAVPVSPDGDWSIFFSKPLWDGDKLRLTVTDNHIGPDRRIVAFDRAGRQYVGHIDRSSATTGMRQSDVAFSGVPRSAEIARFEFQTRDYEWRELRNVALNPDPSRNASGAGAALPASASSNAMQADLVAVGDKPRGGDWWRPDGTPVAPPAMLERLPNDRPSLNDPVFKRQLCFALKGGRDSGHPVILRRVDYLASFLRDPASGDQAIRFGYAGSLTSAPLSLTLGVVAGPWRTLATRQSSGEKAQSLDLLGRRIAFQAGPYTPGHSLASVRWSRQSPAPSPDWHSPDRAWRIVAVARDGRTSVPVHIMSTLEGGCYVVDAQGALRSMNPVSGDEEVLQCEFALPLEQVAQFQFQSADYQWTEFRNIAVAPKSAASVTSASASAPTDDRQKLFADLEAFRSRYPVYADFLRVWRERVTPILIESEHCGVELQAARAEKGEQAVAREMQYDKPLADKHLYKASATVMSPLFEAAASQLVMPGAVQLTQRELDAFLGARSLMERARRDDSVTSADPFTTGTLAALEYRKELGYALNQFGSALLAVLSKLPPDLTVRKQALLADPRQPNYRPKPGDACDPFDKALLDEMRKVEAEKKRFEEERAQKKTAPAGAPGSAQRAAQVRAWFRQFVDPANTSSLYSGDAFTLAWSDIPVLLDLANDASILKEDFASSRFPFSGRLASIDSSYWQKEFRTGLVALWLVECLHTHVYYNLGKPVPDQTKVGVLTMGGPLNPIAFKGKCPQPLEKNEVGSETLHREMVAAYRAWWDKAKSLPPAEASKTHPLAGTDLYWFGDRVRPEPRPAGAFPTPFPFPERAFQVRAWFQRLVYGNSIPPQALSPQVLSHQLWAPPAASSNEPDPFLLAWSDIPVLLELAQNKAIIRSNSLDGRQLPLRGLSSVYSSYTTKEARVGIVALWVIEGLRKHHRMRQERPGIALPAKVNFFTLSMSCPLNPIIAPEGGISPQDGVVGSEALHQQALKAYREWWARTGAPQPTAAALDGNPLAGTGLKWTVPIIPMSNRAAASSRSARSQTYLELRGPQTTDQTLAALPPSDTVRSIDLRQSSITTAGLAHLAKFKNLERVLLDETKLGDRGIEQLARLSTLQEISLMDTQVTDAGLEPLVALPRLQRLTLYKNPITDAGLRTVARMKNVQVLHLGFTRVTDEGMKTIQGLPLVSLELGFSQITNRGLETISKMKLWTLDLHHAKVDDAGMPWIEKMTTLHSLALSGTGVTDAGLVRLEGLKELEWLSLHSTAVTGKGLEHLRPLTKLKELRISRTRVGDEGLSALKSLKSLERLDIDETAISDAGVAELNAAFRNQDRFILEADRRSPAAKTTGGANIK